MFSRGTLSEMIVSWLASQRLCVASSTAIDVIATHPIAARTATAASSIITTANPHHRKSDASFGPEAACACARAMSFRIK